ncbi:ribbon-helix-helix domain-containing protein [Candidatus Pacearchaeota archaeon]|nr:ribbon-helix-helix domain-containing protein [Candidatus Pacearchaeota archaeon]
MPLNNKAIKKIMKDNKEAFDMLEHYDKTREKLWARKRIYITLNAAILKRLKEIREKTGKPISRIIEDSVSEIKK